MKHTRKRYQQGSLTTEKRKNGFDVYIYRWREAAGNGKQIQRKAVLGSVKELTKTKAQKGDSRLHASASGPVDGIVAPDRRDILLLLAGRRSD